MFDIPYPNTRYAEALDYEQQIEYEEELAGEYVTIEEQEEQAFAQRCKQSKVSPTKLKHFDKVYHKITKDAGDKLDSLNKRLNRLRDTEHNAKTKRKIRCEMMIIRAQYDADIEALRAECFPNKRKRKP